MPALTGLRFVLALMVVLFHFSEARIMPNGFVAVGGFFVLSGFVLAHSYLDGNCRLRVSKKEFWAARVARVYPLYVLVIVFALPYRTFNPDHPTGFQDLAASLTVLLLGQAWIPKYAMLVNSAAWSLSVEAFFYLAFPILIRGVARRSDRSLAWMFWGCWLLLLLPPALFLAMGWRLEIQHNPLLHTPAFLMGILLRRMEIRNSSLWGWASLAGLVVASSVTLPREFAHNGLLTPLFAGVIAWMARGSALLGSRPLVLLGEASYALYLLHLPCWALAVSLNGYLNMRTDSAAFLTAAILLSIGVSFGAFSYIEKPYRKVMASVLSGTRQKSAPSNKRAQKANVS